MTNAVFASNGAVFVPVDQEGLDLLSPLRDERDVVLNVKARRNQAPPTFFAILKFMVEHTRLFRQH